MSRNDYDEKIQIDGIIIIMSVARSCEIQLSKRTYTRINTFKFTANLHCLHMFVYACRCQPGVVSCSTEIRRAGGTGVQPFSLSHNKCFLRQNSLFEQNKLDNNIY